MDNEQARKKTKFTHDCINCSKDAYYYPPAQKLGGIKRVLAFHDLTKLDINSEFINVPIMGEVHFVVEK